MTILRNGMAGILLFPTLAWAAAGEPHCAPEVDLLPHLAEIQAKVPPEGVDDAVLQLLERFPNNPGLQGRAVDILLGRQETGRARSLVEGALERFPDCPDAYINALDFYGKVHDAARQQELADVWQARLPGDAGAVHWWLDLGTRQAGEVGQRIERLLSAGGTGAPQLDLCIRILSIPAYREPAVGCLTRTAAEGREETSRAVADGFLAAAGGDPENLAKALPRLPEKRRREAVLTAVRALGDGQCPRKMSLLKLVAWDGKGEQGPFSKFGVLRGCETYPPAREDYLEALANAPARDLELLLQAWFLQKGGVYRDDFALAPRVRAVLLARLKRDPGDGAARTALEKGLFHGLRAVPRGGAY